MKIMQLTPGSGDNFYCENCLRDALMVKSWRRMGYDAIVVPLYLPVGIDDTPSGGTTEIFMGGVNVYLQQKAKLFRKTPRWLDKLLDSPKLLKLVSKRAGATSAHDLADTTISMLEGEHGLQVKELDRFVDWLAGGEKPDVLCLSNALLIGMARRIKERVQVPIVCFLQDEDEFLDLLPEPQRSRAWEIIRERLNDIDLFVAPSEYYTNFMRERLGLDAKRLIMVPAGIHVEDYEVAQNLPDVPTIGFLSRICQWKGLDRLVEAVILLRQREKLKKLRLVVAGGKTGEDDPYLKQIKARLEEAGCSDAVMFYEELHAVDRSTFLQGLTVMSVPETRPPACGMYVLESLASGVPLVLPGVGALGEMAEKLEMGIERVENNTPEELSAKLQPLLLDGQRARDLGRKGRETLVKHFDIDRNSETMIEKFRMLINK